MGRDPDALAWGRDMLSDHKEKGGLTSRLEELNLINDELEQAELSKKFIKSRMKILRNFKNHYLSIYSRHRRAASDEFRELAEDANKIANHAQVILEKHSDMI
jgi:hypothetical protein